MTVYYNKLKKAWLYDFQKNGNRYQGYCYNNDGHQVITKTEAKDAESLLKAQLAKEPQKRPTIHSPNCYTLGEACADYFEKIKQDRKNLKDPKVHIKSFLGFWGIEFPLYALSIEEITKYKDYMLSTPYYRKEGGIPRYRAKTSVNRYLDTLISIKNEALKRKNITEDIIIDMLKTEDPLPNPVKKEDAKKILEHSAEHLYHFIVIDINTGMRLSELCTLKKHQIYLEERLIILDGTTKSRKGRALPINDACMKSIEYFMNMSKDSEYLITYDGKSIKTPRTAWYGAQRRAGIKKHYRLHDLRATFLTLLANQAGSTEYLVSSAAGHSSPRTTRRYLAYANKALFNLVDKISIDD